MSVAQYPRAFSLAVGTSSGSAQEFSAFRVQFQVRRGDKQTPNSADIRIFNLSNATANTIQNEYTQVALQAGYPGNIGLIFRGTIKQVRKGRVDQKDSYVDITAADGDEAYNFSAMALSLAANTANYPAAGVQAMLQTMAKGLTTSAQPVTQGYMPEFPASSNLRARVYFGMTRDELREWATNNDCNWSILDGALTVIPLTSYIPAGEVPLVTPETGLIGVPEQVQNGLRVRTLLNPTLRIGQRIKLSTYAVNQYRYGLDTASVGSNALTQGLLTPSTDGIYYVMAADHVGDSRGQDWYSDLTCLSVNATIPPNQAPFALINPSVGSVGAPQQPQPNGG